MEKHGFLEAIGSSRQGARPERTIYRITDAGRRELVEWARELISTPQPEHPRFAAGLSVLSVLPPEDVIALFRTRLDRLEESIATQRASIAEHSEDVPRLFLIEDEYGLSIHEAEAAWVRSVLDELTSGAFPDLAAWQAWHQTGEISDELAELAKRGTTPD